MKEGGDGELGNLCVCQGLGRVVFASVGAEVIRPI